MLPFLEKKVGSASSQVKSDSIKRNRDEGSIAPALEVAIKELFQSKTDKQRALAFKAAVSLCNKKEK